MLKYYHCRMIIYKIELNIFLFRRVFFLAFYCSLDWFFFSYVNLCYQGWNWLMCMQLVCTKKSKILLVQKSGCNCRGQKETLVRGIKMTKLIDLWLKQSAQVARFYLLSNVSHRISLGCVCIHSVRWENSLNCENRKKKIGEREIKEMRAWPGMGE